MELDRHILGDHDNDPELEWEGRYPTYQQRWGGAMIDALLVTGGAVGLAYLLKNLPEDLFYWRIIAFAIFVFIYEPLMYVIVGGTLGHLAMKMRVRKLNDETQKINIFQAILRYVFKICCGMFSVIRWANTKKNRMLHDFAAGTIMVNVEKKGT